MSDDHTEDSLIQEIQRVAQSLGKQQVSRSEFIRETTISEWQVLKHFDTWNEFVEAAGLRPTDVSRIPDEELFEAMYEAFLAGEGILNRGKFRKTCKYSDWVYAKRWGKWESVLLEFSNWVKTKHPNFPHMDELPTGRIEETPQAARNSPRTGKESLASWPKTGGRVYGQVLNFRGLQHAPVNEQGVVFLFGMVALELGFIVESVATGFPDCEAKRRVSKAKDLWERVSIEFEFQSRNFREHGHDPALCDLIVCWEDNWPDCPIEVLELSSVLGALDK